MAGGLFRQGFVIHSAIHKARHDAVCVWHCHHPDTAAISMTRTGVLPLCQEAVFIANDVAYHPFEGTANDMSEQQRMQASLGPVREKQARAFVFCNAPHFIVVLQPVHVLPKTFRTKSNCMQQQQMAAATTTRTKQN